MYRFLKITFLLFIFIGIYNISIAQITEGRVIYDISFPDIEIPENQRAMLPSESVVWFKGDKARIELEMGSGMEMVMMIDKKNIIMLMNLMGNKIAFKENDPKKENGESYKILEDTKVIAGFQCRKSILNTEEGEPVVVWFTKEISANQHWNDVLKEVPGFPMEFTMKAQQLNMYMLAKSVDSQSVSDDLFKVPDDYKMMSEKELKKLFGGTD